MDRNKSNRIPEESPMTLAEKLVKPIYEMTYEKLPAEVVEKVKLCVLHSLA